MTLFLNPNRKKHQAQDVNFLLLRGYVAGESKRLPNKLTFNLSMLNIAGNWTCNNEQFPKDRHVLVPRLLALMFI